MREFTGMDVEAVRREVLADKKPAILRGLVEGWPSVAAGRESPSALVRYLTRFDTGAAVDALLAPPEIDGRIFYNETMTGFNFVRNRLPLTAVAEQVLRYSLFPKAPSVAAQSALIRDCAPGFLAENRLSLLDEGISPRLWFGNRITTPLHLDAYDNLACVVAGRRRFTLFPPDQIGNLYVGPIDFAPTGAPMSLVRLHDPDFGRFPKFRDALATRQVAELGPGDAIVIPPLWWHHVESLDSFNLLVNYWWQDRTGRHAKADSAFDALLHGILCVRDLPPATRRAWASLFEHYLFGPPGDAVAHIQVERRGILGELSPQQIDALRTQLVNRL
jgi:cupin-like protein